MAQRERFDKISKLLQKFKNGEDLYRKSALFNQAIQMMVEGMNEFEVLEQVILANERTINAFTDYVNRDSRPMSINVSRPDLLK